MKIGIVHRSNVLEVRSLSGIPHFMAKALKQHVGEVVAIGPDESIPTRAIEVSGKVVSRLAYSALRRRISSDQHRLLSRRLARTMQASISGAGCDVLFAPVASVEIAWLSTDLPIVYYSDLNWIDIVDYYPGCSSLFDFARSEGERVQSAAIRKAEALIFPSKWAADSAVIHYGAEPRRVHQIPCGANFEPEDVPARESALNHRIGSEIVLLWIGVDWSRKGGAIAFECFTRLRARGVDARLVVCGCIPPTGFSHPQMEIIPFLNKNEPEQRARLSRLFLDSTFFLFPTQAEAYGIVLCESSAHGLPSLVRDTGGVRGAVTDGENGVLMAPGASGDDYAANIAEILADPGRYRRLVEGSRNAYESRLNWDAWGRAVKPVFEEAARNHRTAQSETRVEQVL